MANLPTHRHPPVAAVFQEGSSGGQCRLGCLPFPDPSKSYHPPAPPASQGEKAERLLAELGFPREERGARRGAAAGSLFCRLCYFMS